MGSGWSWIWWIVGTLGVGGTLLAVAAVVFGWPVLLAFFRTTVGKIVAGVGLVALAMAGVFLKGRSAGRAAERARLKKLTEKEVSDAAAERKRIDALPDEQVDKELARWERK